MGWPLKHETSCPSCQSCPPNPGVLRGGTSRESEEIRPHPNPLPQERESFRMWVRTFGSVVESAMRFFGLISDLSYQRISA
jgi:hypothetical protein